MSYYYEELPPAEPIEIQPYQPPTHDELLEEQQRVQAGKFQGRMLPEYNSTIFPGQQEPKAWGSAVVDLVLPYCQGERASLQGLVAGVREANGGRPLVIADMCGGRGLALRELETVAPGNRLVNVDLFDYGFDGLDKAELALLDGIHPAMRDDATAPEFIAANAATVELSETPDIILGVEGMQYLDNPLGAICNWYNQLRDDGWLIVATGNRWADFLRYEDLKGEVDYERTPAHDLFEVLDEQDVAYAATDCHDRPGRDRDNTPNETRTMIIRKKPGTRLQVNASLLEVETEWHNYKIAFYLRPPDDRPIFEVGPSTDPVITAIASVTRTLH